MCGYCKGLLQRPPKRLFFPSRHNAPGTDHRAAQRTLRTLDSATTPRLRWSRAVVSARPLPIRDAGHALTDALRTNTGAAFRQVQAKKSDTPPLSAPSPESKQCPRSPPAESVWPTLRR